MTPLDFHVWLSLYMFKIIDDTQKADLVKKAKVFHGFSLRFGLISAIMVNSIVLNSNEIIYYLKGTNDGTIIFPLRRNE